jgi:hypothetical protein
MHKKLESLRNIPKIGDLIGCSDNDFGIVVNTYDRGDGTDTLMVSVKWHSGRVLTDPWDAQSFTNECDLFWIMSRI